MKCIAVLAVLTLLCVVDYTSATNALLASFAKPCKKEENASDQDVTDLSNGIPPETPEGKCLTGKIRKI